MNTTCCEKCFGRQGTRAGGGTYCNYLGCACHKEEYNTYYRTFRTTVPVIVGEVSTKDNHSCPLKDYCPYHPKDTPTDSWEAELREFFDKSLKAKKPTMKNLERELLVNFVRNQRKKAKREVVEFIRAKSEEAVKGLWYVQETTLESALIEEI